MTENEKKNLLSAIKDDARCLTYLQDSKYKKIAICGYRESGRILYNRLISAGFEISFIVERNYEALRLIESMDVPIIGFDNAEIFKQAEVMIITPDLDYEVIKECLELAGIEIPIIMPADILME